MRELKKEEMIKASGGAVNPVVITGIVGVAVAFIIGVLHGFSNPQSCNN